MLTWSKCCSCKKILVAICCCTLARWYVYQTLTQFWTSFFKPCHTNLEDTSFRKNMDLVKHCPLPLHRYHWMRVACGDTSGSDCWSDCWSAVKRTKSIPKCTACTVALERQSATTLLIPSMCWISIVNSDMKTRWHCCWDDQGSETLDMVQIYECINI